MNYDILKTPFNIGKMTVKNRIAMAPMGLNSGHIDGTIADDEIDYFEERAKGGTGLIIMGCQFLTQELAQGSMEGYLDHTYVIPQLTTLVEAVHRYDAKICAQLSCGTGKNAFANMLKDGRPVSASEIPSMFNPDLLCRALSVEEIRTIMTQFTYSAKLLKDAGFDAIEVHAHAGYLVDQFMSAIWNKREDEYGGSPENRMRFAIDIVEAIREAVGPDMPIIFRMAVKHNFEGGRTLEETIPLMKLLEQAGVDALDIDSGSYENIDYIFPPAYLGDACMADVCETARQAVSIPLLNAGNHTPETAVELVEGNKADFVLMGRPLIAEPEMAKKLFGNRRDEVRPCIRCNDDCIGRILTRLTKISCSVNPSTGFERRFRLTKTNQPKNVVIIGGGPGGMEAARTAALMGHRVELFEKEAGLGGQLRSAATPPFKSQLRALVTWYEHQMEINHITVHLNTAIDENHPALASADAIIVATGAIPLELDILGIEKTVNILDAHLDESKLQGDKIIYCGGGLSACDSALETALKGKKVTVVERLGEVAIQDHFINKASLIPMMINHGVELLTNHCVVEILDDGIKAIDGQGQEVFIAGTTVVSAFGMKANTKIAKAIDGKYHDKVRLIGDCDKVGKVGGAVRGGMYAAMGIE